MFSGVGAEAVGGRFNRPGRRAVYAAGSLSLGILELVVQGNARHRLKGLVCASVSFDERFLNCLEIRDLPAGWNSRPASSVSQCIGDAWLDSQESLVLRVPSVVVPGEYNYIINPGHPDIGGLDVGELRPVDLDPRIV